MQSFELVTATLAHVEKLGGGKSLRIAAESRWYRSPAYPADSGPDYVNGVLSVATTLTPLEILTGLHEIEATFGRERKGRWASRTLDLDLIDYEGRVLPDLAQYRAWAEAPDEKQRNEAPDQLILPHPRMQDRAFVLVPLRDVAPDWHHPVTGRHIDELIAALPAVDLDALQPI